MLPQGAGRQRRSRRWGSKAARRTTARACSSRRSTSGASVERALRGAEGAYLLLPPDPSSDDFVAPGRRIAGNFAAALRKSPVRHAVLLSSVGAALPSGTGPIVTAHEAERALGAVKTTAFTFLRAAYFMENLLAYAHAMRADGVLPVFGGGGGHALPMVATADIGEVAAAALLAPPAATEVVDLSGPREYSFDDAAREASALLGRPVRAVDLPIEGLVPALTGFGVSPNVAGLYRERTEALGAGRVRPEGVGRAVRGKTELGAVLGAALR
ncbi:MAG TPA: hypothetical protein VFS43_12265 [Polyangiaceae bacterium]|nr:hypothetical protein [Polyangiaceae bacterium]